MRIPLRAFRTAVVGALVAIPPALAGPENDAFHPPAFSFQRIATAFSPAVAEISVANRKLALELTPGSVQAALSPGLFHNPFWGVTATLRLLDALNPGTGRGFFLEPKLSAAFQQGALGSHFARASTLELVAGVDFGYQFAIGPIQLAPVIEANAVSCFGCGDQADASRFRLIALTQVRANRVAIDLRADFLRLRFQW